MPFFSNEVLLKMKNQELWDICQKYNIKQGIPSFFAIFLTSKKGKKKSQLIENVQKRVGSVHQNLAQLEALQSDIKSNYLDDPAPTSISLIWLTGTGIR